MLRKLKNNNKGAFTTWQKGWMLLILFFVFTFAIDICILALEIATESHQLSYVAEKLSFQGGFIGATSEGAATWTNKDIYDYFSRSFIRFGTDGVHLHFKLVAKEGGSTVVIINTNSGAPVQSNYKSRSKVGVNQISKTYGEEASLTLSFDHKLFFSSRVFPFLIPIHTYQLTERYYNLYINS